MIRTVAWVAMALLAFAVGAYAVALLLVPAMQSPLVAGMLARAPWAAVGHMAGGAFAILVGALQANRRLRTRHLNLHRWLGRAYVIAVAAGGLSALRLSFHTAGGTVANFGFGLLAVCWVTSTLVGYRMIRAGNQPAHRAWMLRSYALTLAAVTLRLYIPIAVACGLTFETVYPAAAWGCWVPNLLIVEWWMLARRETGVVVKAPVAMVTPTPR